MLAACERGKTEALPVTEALPETEALPVIDTYRIPVKKTQRIAIADAIKEYSQFKKGKQRCAFDSECVLIHSDSCELPCVDAIASKYRETVQKKLNELATAVDSYCIVDCIQASAACIENKCVLSDRLPPYYFNAESTVETSE